ncbi:MAG: methyltransferase family protein [Omnitrophica WOR_2 bacterium]
MNTKTEIRKTESRSDVLSGIALRAIQISVGLIVLAVILFLSAGRLDWIWAWVFLGIYLVSISINSIFMLRTRRETIAERSRPKEMKDWDKIISGLWSIAQFLVIPLVAGLDLRFGWTREPGIPWHLAGAALFALGLALFGWAMITNTFFSTAVRIQSDRGQIVCRTGPYRFVRHPGYTGVILQSFSIPILFGSLWTLIPALAAVVLMMIRTALEDRTLQADLTGYRDFAQEVRYRLIPGVW